MKTKTSYTKGKIAENVAQRFLLQQGLTLLQSNFRSKAGEIDFIMQDHKTIVFIEVRARRNADYGDAIDSVNQSKRQKIIKTAYSYLQKHNSLNDALCRFDIISIIPKQGYSDNLGDYKIDWLKHAFDVDDF